MFIPSVHLYLRREPIEQVTQKTIKKVKAKNLKASITPNADIQNVAQCRYHMHRSDIEHHLYIYQRNCQIYTDSTQPT